MKADVAKIEVIRYPAQQVKVDRVAAEQPLQIWLKYYLNSKQTQVEHLLTTMRTPGADEQLIRGWLISNQIIPSQDILRIQPFGTDALRGTSNNQHMVIVKPGCIVATERLQRGQASYASCGVCGTQDIERLLENLDEIQPQQRIRLSVPQVLSLSAQIAPQQSLFQQTGGVHAAALIDGDGKVLDVCEDIGRHNAMDKLIGHHYRRFPGKYAVWLSGRVSFEMIQKALSVGISMVICVGAPSSLAVQLCQQWDIALLGFVRAGQFNLYHGQAQLLSAEEGK